MFKKYEEQGAYHWKVTYSGNFRRSSPRAHALYDVPLDLVTKKLGAPISQLLGADIGCGDGVLLYKAMQRGGKIIGIDLSYTALLIAAREISKRSQRLPLLLNASCYELPLKSGVLDYVIAVELIEHLEFDQDFIREVVRVLRPGGIFVCTTPRKLPNGPPVRDPYHVREYTADELAALLSAFFEDVEILGLYPEWLDKIYLGTNDRPRWLSLLVRFIFKLFAFIWNPYRYIIVQSYLTSKTVCANLIGLGRKPGHIQL
jgi:SAM-dependent methyltransferase